MRPRLASFGRTSPSTFAWTLLGATLVACGFSASHAPLGGDYRAIEAPSPARHAARADATKTPDDAGASEQTPEKKGLAATTLVNADAGASVDNPDLVRYEPLKAEARIGADIAISLSAEFRGNAGEIHANGSNMRLEAKLHVALKIVKSSAQSLDELEVTLTPVSMHTDFDGQGSDSDQDPPETYDVMLSGQTPSIRAQSGAPLEQEDRIILMVLLTPLLEFHTRWVRSPTLDLKPGWSSQIPLAPPAFMSAPGESVHVGPLSVRYAGRDAGATSVPFDIGFPVAWSSDSGSLKFDCHGRAVLGAKGRPLSLDLSGPISGNVGPSGSQMGLRGSAKFGATLTYP
jgi:hypothetical protein